MLGLNDYFIGLIVFFSGCASCTSHCIIENPLGSAGNNGGSA